MKNIKHLLSLAVIVFGLFAGKNYASSTLHPGSDNDKGNGNCIILGYNDGIKFTDFYAAQNTSAKEFFAGISSNEEGVASITIKDSEGKTKWNGTLNLNKGYNGVKLMVKNFTEGLYFMHIETKSGKAERAFVVR